MNKYWPGIVLLLLVLAPLRTPSKETSPSSPELAAQLAFFNNLRKMCREQFAGETEFPKDADHPMVGKKLLMSLQVIPEKQQFMYYLERNNQPRYRAYFDLKSLSRAKQNPKAPVFTSLYTDMKRDCRFLPEPKGADTGGDPAGVCKGYGGYRIFISHSAWSAQFSIQSLKNKSESIDLGNDYGGYGARGEKVEWRTANRVPFAVIMRLGKYKERDDGENPYTVANRTGSTLVVKGLKGWEHIDFKIDGTAAGANAKARELADQNYSRK